MTVFYISTALHADERAHSAGAEAVGLWAMARAWMSRNGAPGRISADRARALASDLGSAEPDALAARLVACGLWCEEGCDFLDVDYLADKAAGGRSL